MKAPTIFTCTCCDQFISGEGSVDNLEGRLVGVLCFECVRAITVMRENSSRLQKVANYLVRIGVWLGKERENNA